VERHLLAVGDHVLHAFHPEHVGDLVRIAHGSHGAMCDRQPCELRGDEHAALHVHVRVHEARQQVAFSPAGDLLDERDATASNGDFRREDPPCGNVDEVALDGE